MDSILQRLTELEEVASAIVIGKDGLIVSGALQNDEEEIVGAMSATVFSSIASFATQVQNSEIRHAIIETEKGTIQLAEASDLILVVTTNTVGNLGRVRLEMKKACHQLAELVATY